MKERTVHTTSTGDSVDLRASRLDEDRKGWRAEAAAREGSWTEEWVILTTFRRSGDKAFWSERGRTPYPGNATRYANEDTARNTAENLLARDVIDDYSLECRERPRGGLRSRGG
jgi:hypothetical protein